MALQPARGSVFPQQGNISKYDTNPGFTTTVNKLHNWFF